MSRISWTPELDDELRSCINVGYQYPEIAQIMGVTEISANTRWRRLTNREQFHDDDEGAGEIIGRKLNAKISTELFMERFRRATS